jgi:hypothetical protein
MRVGWENVWIEFNSGVLRTILGYTREAGKWEGGESYEEDIWI